MNVTIIGCGWLGQLVGAYLIKRDHQVFGNYRTQKTRDDLEKIGIQPFEFEAGKMYKELPGSITDKTDILILSFPPMGNDLADYAVALQNIVLDFPDSVRVLFTSSTSVYPKTYGDFDESYEFHGKEKLNRLYLAEKGLRAILEGRLTIVRLGGLVGPGRHPIRSLSGKELSTDGSAPINLIDGRDIARCMHELIKNQNFGELFNLVYPLSTPKKEYYSAVANRLDIESPRYTGESDVVRKVTGRKVVDQLSFSYQFSPEDLTDLHL